MRPGGGATTAEARTRVGEWVAHVAVRVTPYSRGLWTVTLATLLADLVLTVYGVRLGLRELNPVAAALIAEAGPVAALATLKGGALAVGAAGWVALPFDYRGVVPLALAVPWVTATAVNLLTMWVALTA